MVDRPRAVKPPGISFAAAMGYRVAASMSLAGAAPRTLLSWPPPDAANPYLRRLGAALADRGVTVRSAKKLAYLCARPAGGRWLHVHWPEWMLHDASRARYRARARWLLALLALARAQGVRLAWTAHNLLGHDDPHPDLGEGARRALLSRCDVVFGHFDGAEADLRRWGLRGRFVLTPHPHLADDHPEPFVDVDARRRFRESLGVPDGGALLVSAGAIERYKNLDAVARALRAVPDVDLRWVVAGRARPAALASLREAAGGDRRVTLRPWHHDDVSLSRLVAASDATLVAYRAFYTSGAAVLSLTLGAPVVGHPLHQLAGWVGQPFFVPLDRVDGPSLSKAVAGVRGLDPSARDAARAFARRSDWATAAASIDGALFGGEA